jgi:hypothetical protein
MSLDDVVQLTITTQTVFPTRLGFGIPLLLAYHTVTPEVVRSYKSIKEITDAGFSVNHPVYKMAQACFSQNPRPTSVVVGKRTRVHTQTVRLIPVTITQGFVYSFVVVTPAGVETTISYTVPGAATVASIVTALTALINPLVGVDAVDATTHVTVTPTTAGDLFDLRDMPRPSDMKVLTVTANPGSGGIVADLTDVEAIDSTTWYGILIDSNSEAEINALAAAVETRRKLFIASTMDSDVLDNAVTTDIASDLKTANYARTAIMYYGRQMLNYPAAAWMGGMLPTDPGAGTWIYRTLAGITVDALTGGQATNADTKRANHYTNLGGINVTRQGYSSSGEFLDVTHFVDFLFARIQETIFAALAQASASGKKIPYTDAGVDVVRGLILSVLTRGIQQGGLAADPAPVVTAPKVTDVDPADRAARILPDVNFTATLAGAIHKLQIEGILSV